MPFCRELVTGKDVILHLAHSSHPLTSELDLAGDIVSNVLPSTTLLQAVLEVGNKPHIVFARAAGATATGEGVSGRPFTEEDQCVPVSGYGIQKLDDRALHQNLGTPRIPDRERLRITNAYGTLLPVNRRQGLIESGYGENAQRPAHSRLQQPE